MSSIRKPTRYAHSSGHTDVCYSQDGEKLITCGTDGDIRVWASIDDYDPFQTCVGEWSLCVRQAGKHILIAIDNNTVQLLSYPDGERDGFLTRFSAPVTHMAVGNNHNFVAVASEDMEIRLIDTSKSNETIKNFTGLTGPPLSIALNPSAKVLAVSSGDGFLRFWDVDSTSVLKEFDCVPKANTFSNASVLCRMDFEPVHGNRVAHPTNQSITVLKTSNFSIDYTLTSDATDSPISIVQYSPCGRFIAAATTKGDIIVWEVESRDVIEFSSHPTSKAVCALAWNPKQEGEIAFCDVDGQLGVVVNCLAKRTSKEYGDVEVGDAETKIDFGDVQFEDDDDEDNENAVSLEKLKNSVMGEISAGEDDKASSRSVSPRSITPRTQMQPPFMPSSTPEHLDPRYLCWNHIGIVRSYTATGESIEAEFHDSTFHNTMMVQNFNNYTMGSLSATVLLLANSEQIQVIPLLSGTKDWMVSVEDKTNIMCVAASNKLVCFVTSNYLVHIFMPYGTQKSVISIPGPVVCMSAHEDLLLIAYHSSEPRDDDQCINFILLKLDGLSINRIDLNNILGPKSTLYWMGFTDVGSPVVMDSNELLFIYLLSSNVWVPICDTTIHTTSACHSFFVTSVSETTGMVAGIRCKGSKYPCFVPRPMQSELPLLPTFAEITTEKSQLGANLFLSTHLAIENKEKKSKEVTLKSFALACKNSLDQRALELIELVENKQMVNLAIKYASKLEKRRLVEKLTDLQSSLHPEDGENLSEFRASNEKSVTKAVLKPNRKLLMGMSAKNRNRKPMVEDPILNTPNNLNLSSAQNSNVSTPDPRVDNSLEISLGNSSNILADDEPRNPFAKNLKKATPALKTSNPLNLTDKFAGYEIEQKENASKRKQPETNLDSGNPKEKQRKLFSFAKKF